MKVEEKKKLCNKIFSRILLALFIAFMAIYVSSATGYYEFEQHNKMILTEEKAAFAEDQRQRERKEDNQRIIEKLPRTICQVGNAGSKGTPGKHFQSEIDQKSGSYVRKESDNILYIPLAPDCGKRES